MQNREEAVALEVLKGVLANPNYNLSDPKKAVTIATAHASAFVAMFPESQPEKVLGVVVPKAVEKVPTEEPKVSSAKKK